MILLQSSATLVPEALTGYREMRDGMLRLTAHDLSFVQQRHKMAQAVPYGVLVVLIILFFVRAINGTLPVMSSSIMLFSLVAAVSMLIYSAYRFYQIVSAPAEGYRLEIPLVSIVELAEEELKFTRGRRVLCVRTYGGKSHRFATTASTADWVEAIGKSLQEGHERSLQFRRDGDIATWRVRGIK
jgi:hypothetical protein